MNIIKFKRDQYDANNNNNIPDFALRAAKLKRRQ